MAESRCTVFPWKIAPVAVYLSERMDTLMVLPKDGLSKIGIECAYETG